MGTTGQSITLANSIIGVGILAMPFCFQQCGVLLATLILLMMGLVSRLCCYFLLKSAIITRRRNYEFLAFHVFGPAGKMAVEMGIIGFLMGTCIAYFVVVGDLGPQIIAKLLNINQSDILRTSIMIIVSLVCVLPLGLLRNVDSLSNVSAATIAFYFCLVIKLIAEATGQLFTRDWMSRIELWKPSGVLQCVPIFSMALFCQTQLFEIFESLPTISLEKMCVVTKNAINICAGVYFTLGIFGYIAFNSQEISGNILMSLSPTMASDVIKLGFVMSLAFSFPLVIFPCRASLYSFLYRRAHPSHHEPTATSIPEGPFRLLTLGIVGSALVVSLLLPTVELVLGLVGATIGVLVCLVFPAAAFLHVTYKDTNERLLAKFVVVLGFIILVLGTYANLQAAENTRDKYDDRYITKERIDKIVEDFFQKQEKSEEVMVEPHLDSQPVLQNDINILHNPVIKDSEVQPPNPVPPESHSNEKIPVIFPVHEEKIVKNTLKESKDTVIKASESHPKDIKTKMNGMEKLANGEKLKMANMAEKSKIVLDNLEKPKEEKLQSSQEKSDMMKQQQLIETIKQHGQEQKELIKEQKEILDELIKTKKELQQNKKEIDSSEAKKIAVESIQKIANVAIQKISGVSEKPDDEKDDKKSEPFEKIENEAINKIAKKAEEALDAIQQMDKVKLEPEKLPQINNKIDKGAVIIEQAINTDPKLDLKDDNVYSNNNVPNIIADPKIVRENQESSNIVEDKQSNIKREIPKPITEDKSNNLQENERKMQVKEMKQDGGQNLHQEKLQVSSKEHPQSPVEPQSQQQGEDLQKKVNSILNPNSNVQNDPLLEVKKEKESLNDIVEPEMIKNDVKENGAIKFRADDILSNIANGKNIIPRRKREVVDCTEKTLLKPEDKQICENYVNIPAKDQNQEIIFPKVNLVEVGLSNSLQAIALHHMRSLKSIQEHENR